MKVKEIMKDKVSLDDPNVFKESYSCDECHIEMSKTAYKRNKGLCDVCIQNIN